MQLSVLEESGWRQGSFVKAEVLEQILDEIKSYFTVNSNAILIVASQSCDVATSQEDYIELSIAHPLSVSEIKKENKNNRHPRILHIEASMNKPGERLALCFLSHEKILIKKTLLYSHKPDISIKFSEENLIVYVDWLSNRYKRPALPTKFDRLISDADKNKKRRKKIFKKSNSSLTGVYVRINPNRDTIENEIYSVDLIGTATDEGSIEIAKQALKDYSQIMQDAGMDVSIPVAVTEFQVSVGTLRQYQRINFDYLSYEENTPLPPDTEL